MGINLLRNKNLRDQSYNVDMRLESCLIYSRTVISNLSENVCQSGRGFLKWKTVNNSLGGSGAFCQLTCIFFSGRQLTLFQVLRIDAVVIVVAWSLHRGKRNKRRALMATTTASVSFACTPISLTFSVKADFHVSVLPWETWATFILYTFCQEIL